MNPGRTVVLLEERHVGLYLTNAWFKLAVDTLSEFLPALVDGLALQAEEKQHEMGETIRKMETVRGILEKGL